MLKIILVSLAVVVAGFVIVVALQPSDFRITRTSTIAAPPETVFAQVNDLHQWQAWSPWAKMDPAAKNIFAGPPSGTGAALTWAGNKEVGEGTMTITESRPNELVQLRLEFKKPFEATNLAEFTFKPEGHQTVVTWSMTGTNNFVFKAIGLFMNCDQMIGGQFELGFANLKAVVETTPKS